MNRPARISTLAAALALAAAAPAAAHTSATYTLDHGEARCMGTIADRYVSPAAQPASLVVHGDAAQLVLGFAPLVSIFQPPLDVDGTLACDAESTMMRCGGIGLVAQADGVSIDSWSTGDGSSAMIRLTDGPAPAAVPQAAPKPAPKAHHHRHHTRKRGGRR